LKALFGKLPPAPGCAAKSGAPPPNKNGNGTKPLSSSSAASFFPLNVRRISDATICSTIGVICFITFCTIFSSCSGEIFSVLSSCAFASGVATFSVVAPSGCCPLVCWPVCCCAPGC